VRSQADLVVVVTLLKVVGLSIISEHYSGVRQCSVYNTSGYNSAPVHLLLTAAYSEAVAVVQPQNNKSVDHSDSCTAMSYFNGR